MDKTESAPEPANGQAASRLGLGILLSAAVLAIGAVGYRAWDTGAGEPQAEAVDSSQPLTIAELEARAKASPLDSAAWEELGFAYYADGQFEQAARAYRQAVEGDPESAELWAALGEARVLASKDDPMPPLAVSAFKKAVQLDPKQQRARYYLAARRDLSGDHEGAIAEWVAILAEAPPGAVYEENLLRTIRQIGKINNIEVESRIAAATKNRPDVPQLTAGEAIPGPTRQQIDAARAMAPGEQQDMAEGMVARLEERLKSEPANVDGWVMLMRSRVTLGQQDRASKALKDAIAANPQAADRLRQEARVLGVS
ncbi:tetratricopeptide repeat protein [Altererythrobacter sp. H2]|uniref:tetratricopeptide repeat protein n=1 Tax=Altererythrobacter sp. H2 TaxID=3108391 RepID=UPI002B4C11B4|nr:tetratricopeptide repeat protein [Altererythrobacter sp. H2]WRK95652.1 tetratricopeptide repeat protein [Altererythrobacter sp. H2]